MSKFDDAVEIMRNALTSPLSKIEGTFSMFNIRAVAQDHAQISNNMEIINDNWSLDTAAGAYLDEKAKDFGMTRHVAQYATGMVTFTGVSGSTIPGGTVVSAPEYGVKFITQENLIVQDEGTASVMVTCTTLGPAGNVPAGAVNTIDKKIQGVTSVTNEEAFTGGVDREDDDSFRLRIYFKIRYPATSGNIYHYQQWATEVSGVGAVKVFPLWNGPGTVKVSILDANGDPATEDLIEQVQEYIDPEPQQNGGGQAPIGALVTVTTATAKAVNVAATVDLGSTAGGIDAVKMEFQQALTDHFHEIAYDNKTVSISPAQVGNILFDVPGVVDYANLTLNGGTANIPIGEEEVLQVGTITLSLPTGG